MASWFETWFDSKYYPILYQQRDDEEAAAFIDKLINQLNPSKDTFFLDLACGRGRHCRQICRLGYKIHGADYSISTIEDCKACSPEYLHFYQHDMRDPLPHSYDVILNLFTSFGYFENDQEHLQTLRNISNALNVDGLLVLDFLNVDHIKRTMVPHEELMLQGVRFDIRRYMDDHRIHKKIEISDGDHSEVYDEEVTAYTKTELEAMLKAANFEILNIFGDYELRSFQEGESDRLIFVARKC